jgi:hypothetical protein
MRHVPPKRRFAQEPHRDTSQKTTFFTCSKFSASLYSGIDVRLQVQTWPTSPLLVVWRGLQLYREMANTTDRQPKSFVFRPESFQWKYNDPYTDCSRIQYCQKWSSWTLSYEANPTFLLKYTWIPSHEFYFRVRRRHLWVFCVCFATEKV